MKGILPYAALKYVGPVYTVDGNHTIATGRQRLLKSVFGSIHIHSHDSKGEIGQFCLFCLRMRTLCSFRKEAYYGKDLILADRDMVETESDEILRDADKEDVALLVVGDPFGYASNPRSNNMCTPKHTF